MKDRRARKLRTICKNSTIWDRSKIGDIQKTTIFKRTEIYVQKNLNKMKALWRVGRPTDPQLRRKTCLIRA